MITQKDFLEKYNISKTDFEKTGLEWQQMEAIYNAYKGTLTALEPTLAFFVERLRSAPKVHSIKTRLKDPEHLVEKIIRERLETPTIDVTVDMCNVS